MINSSKNLHFTWKLNFYKDNGDGRGKRRWEEIELFVSGCLSLKVIIDHYSLSLLRNELQICIIRKEKYMNTAIYSSATTPFQFANQSQLAISEDATTMYLPLREINLIAHLWRLTPPPRSQMPPERPYCHLIEESLWLSTHIAPQLIKLVDVVWQSNYQKRVQKCCDGNWK